MPIIDKCTECGRKNGYGTDANNAVCARCEQSNGSKESNNENNEN